MNEGFGPPDGMDDVSTPPEPLQSGLGGENPIQFNTDSLSMTGQDAPMPEAAVPPPPAEPRPVSENLQRRLGKLVRQRNEAREARDNIQLQAEERITALENQLRQAQQANYRPAPTTYTDPGAGYGLAGDPGQGQTEQPPAPGVNVQELIRQELAPIVQHFGNIQKQEAARTAHDNLLKDQGQSLQVAETEFKELRDPGSQLFQLTDHLLKTNDALAGSPNGPYEAALMATGLLASDAQASQTSERSKIAAGVVNRPAQGAPTAAGSGNVEQYNKGLRSLLTDRGFGSYKAAREAQLRANYEAQDVGGVFPEGS
jgi:hypothetical protein